MDTYKIIRMWNPYAPENQHKRGFKHTIDRGLTLEEAQAHCRDPKTRKAGIWFDGYEKE